MKHYGSWKDVPTTSWRWKNFSPREIACKGTGQLLVDEVALDKLQELRDTLDIPITLVSAYRSPEHNRKVGGAKNSYHMKGCAFDISVANQDPMMLEIIAREVGFRGFGFYPKSGFMHVDLGPERTWGTPFKRGATRLVPEPEKREKATQSTTVQATAVQVASGAGAAATAVSALDGTAQIVTLVLAGLVILSALWILRERLRSWAEGNR